MDFYPVGGMVLSNAVESFFTWVFLSPLSETISISRYIWTWTKENWSYLDMFKMIAGYCYM